MPIELICLDMAGTTVNDQGLVLRAFRRTIDELGVTGADAASAEAYVIETMGQSKIEVFTGSSTSAPRWPTTHSSATSSKARLKWA